MSRVLFLLYGTAAYLIFFATFLYLIAFVGDLPGVPRTIDRGPEAATGVALAIDLALIALFGVQHSVMARPGFKARWTRVVPLAAERSIYLLATALALVPLIFLWQPTLSIVWSAEAGFALAGWTYLLAASLI